MEYTLDYFIDKFEKIPEEMWITNYWNEGDKNCALGHCGCRNEHGSNGKFPDEANALEAFLFYTTEINDGNNRLYQQPTPKQRILAALYDLKANEAVKEAQGIADSSDSILNHPIAELLSNQF